MARRKNWSRDICAAIKERLAYNPKTGDLTFKYNHPFGNFKIGDIAGGVSSQGYIQIGLCINGKDYNMSGHRIAWFLYYGAEAALHIDHVNGNRADNRIENLRLATRSQNMHNMGKNINNTSGFKGVNWCKNEKRWRAQIGINGFRKHLGFFDTAKEAHEAYKHAADLLHKDFKNYG